MGITTNNVLHKFNLKLTTPEVLEYTYKLNYGSISTLIVDTGNKLTTKLKTGTILEGKSLLNANMSVARLHDFKSKGINIKAARSKFNGRLIVKWTTSQNGIKIYDNICKFKEFILTTFNIPFIEYLAFNTPSQIRLNYIMFSYLYLRN